MCNVCLCVVFVCLICVCVVCVCVMCVCMERGVFGVVCVEVERYSGE